MSEGVAVAAADRAKRAAAEAAVALVEPGMRVGLGTGSTAAWMVRLLAERVRQGLEIVAVPTSEATAALARDLGIRLAELDELGALDLTIDGADEIGPGLALIKGGGGALLREKIVAAASARMVVIADAAKLVSTLGAFPLPVEVVPFGLAATARAVERVAGVAPRLRMAGEAAFVTDEGNRILDLALGAIADPPALDAALNAVPGVVETGLFCGIADLAFIGHGDGEVEERAA